MSFGRVFSVNEIVDLGENLDWFLSLNGIGMGGLELQGMIRFSIAQPNQLLKNFSLSFLCKISFWRVTYRERSKTKKMGLGIDSHAATVFRVPPPHWCCDLWALSEIQIQLLVVVSWNSRLNDLKLLLSLSL